MTALQTTRRRLLSLLPISVFGAATVSSSALALTDEPDPIYAAIERHRLAYQAMDEASEYISDEAFEEDYVVVEIEAASELVKTEPTTIAGVAAVLSYLHEMEDYGDRCIGSDNMEVGDGRKAEPHHFLYGTLASALAKILEAQS